MGWKKIMNSEDLQILKELAKETRKSCQNYGEVANYIPQLAKASPGTLGITVHRMGKEAVSVGDSENLFTLQSISKVFTLIMALMDCGEEELFEKVGMEATGDDFNSMIKLEEVETGKPFNPMINAGAIAVTSLIKGETSEIRSERLLNFIRTLAADNSIGYNQDVYHSEMETADLNRSLAYLLKNNKILTGNVEEHLKIYTKQCSIEVTCRQLARMALVLANHGIDPDHGTELVPRRYAQIAKVFMATCGMYNASGEFAVEVGIPAKSGVSGGIMAIVPGKMGIGVIGPALSDMGNSMAGVYLLKQLSRKWELSIF
jgi:glutaminase